MKKLLIIGVVLFLVFSWGIYTDLMTEKSDPQVLLQQVRMLGSQKIHGIEILSANTEKGIVERKRLNRKEIAFVQELLKNADTNPVGGHNYLTYECRLVFYLEGDIVLNFSGINYGQYKDNKEDLYLSPEHKQDKEEQHKFYKMYEPIRVKYLGKWIVTHIKHLAVRTVKH